MKIRLRLPDTLHRLWVKVSALLSGFVIVLALEPNFRVKVVVEVEMGDEQTSEQSSIAPSGLRIR